MGLRKIRPVERCACVGVLDLATNACSDPVDRDRGKLGGVQDVTYVFRVHRKPGKNYLGFDTCTLREHVRTRSRRLVRR